MLWRRRIEPFTRPLVYAFFRMTRGLTLGVRAVVTDETGKVLLIQHTYIKGWYLPGGGVERGETAEIAVVRELQEEAGVRALSRPRLVSAHSNEVLHPGDHVLLYRIEAWEPCASDAEGEIHAVGWFDPNDLPEETTKATRRRIAEALGDAEPDVMW
ncbi:NUDIX domain-containing protein [Caulobacter sp. 602-1]|uniref:NUDIX domain-containing protein n=1 Tax=Caulobacter sp. 602-1 TaxID=2492472 RepID=UPI000F63B1A3|nr:NUDIX domain-containing protein [Caulobacter sp. 602-1]RRN64196.1 NUDIX domain-containing protein [Caulobacter sp. 602-1]